MKMLPQNELGWLRIAVLPFQAFVSFGWVSAQIYNWLDVYGRRPDPHFEGMVILGYMFCFFFLITGAFLQKGCGDRNGFALSLVAAFVALAADWLMLPSLAQP